jgi:hypothetical protein
MLDWCNQLETINQFWASAKAESVLMDATIVGSVCT